MSSARVSRRLEVNVICSPMGKRLSGRGRIVIGTTGLQISDRDLKGSNSNGMAALRNFMDSLNYGSTGIRVRMADLSDGVLCINATAASGTGLRWEVRERYLPHVAGSEEARSDT